MAWNWNHQFLDELPKTTYWTECISIARLDYQILPVFLSVLASALFFFFFGADDSLSDSESADDSLLRLPGLMWDRALKNTIEKKTGMIWGDSSNYLSR